MVAFLLGRMFLCIVYPDEIGQCGLFFSFVVDLDVLINLVRCETGKAFQVAFVDCLYQHGDDRII